MIWVDRSLLCLHVSLKVIELPLLTCTTPVAHDIASTSLFFISSLYNVVQEFLSVLVQLKPEQLPSVAHFIVMIVAYNKMWPIGYLMTLNQLTTVVGEYTRSLLYPLVQNRLSMCRFKFRRKFHVYIYHNKQLLDHAHCTVLFVVFFFGKSKWTLKNYLEGPARAMNTWTPYEYVVKSIQQYQRASLRGTPPKQYGTGRPCHVN